MSYPDVQSAALEPRREVEPLEPVLGSEVHHRVVWAMAQLPRRMKACLALCIDQELNDREIAIVLQISLETVRANIYQARIRIRSALAAETMERDRAS